MKRFLCLRFPRWPIQRLVSVQPELKAQPLLLYERDGRQTERVVHCSAEAAGVGIEWGMPLGEALALYQQASDDKQASSPSQPVLAFAYDPLADRAALQQLAEKMEIFSPLVGWDAMDVAPEKRSGASRPLDYLVLDVTGISSLFGGEESLLERVLALCAKRGYQVSAAISETIGGSWALAFWEEEEPQEDEPHRECEAALESSASRLPPIIPPGQLRAALDPLPVSCLRLEEKTTALLWQLGVRRVADLHPLPREGLAVRFGQQMLLRLDRVLGDIPDSLILFRPPAEFAAEWRLEYPTDSPEILVQLFQRLLERISAALTRERQGALRLLGRIKEANHTHALQVGLFRPSAAAAYLWSLARVSFEQLQLTGEVQAIEVEATLTAPLEQHQQQLFADSIYESGQDLALLLDRLGSRLGMQAVLRPVATGDPLPERAVEYVPVVGGAQASVKAFEPTRRAAKALGRNDQATSSGLMLFKMAGLRPLTLFAEPQAVAARHLPPHGPPLDFAWRGQRRRIVRYSGPERIESGWRRGRTIRRDYYRAELENGERFWLFRALPRGGWFLHGVFD